MTLNEALTAALNAANNLSIVAEHAKNDTVMYAANRAWRELDAVSRGEAPLARSDIAKDRR